MENRNFTIDYLRGLAALMVCVCHFKHALPEEAANLATYGELGVQVFFVISGYIIPYSLQRGRYRIFDFGLFWLKRLIRLQPTLIAALIFTYIMSYFASIAKGGALNFTFLSVFHSFVYLSIPEENPVIWTLIVELKYYLFVSIFFPILFSRVSVIRRISFFICLAMAACFFDYFNDLRYLPYFLLGFAVCYFETLKVSRIEAVVLLLLSGLSALPSSTAPQILAGIMTCFIIFYCPPVNFRIGIFLGAISYSLYIIHFPLGVKILNFSLAHTPAYIHVLLLPIDIIICVIFAYGLFKAIEDPSGNIAKRIRFSMATRGARKKSFKNKSGLA